MIQPHLALPAALRARIIEFQHSLSLRLARLETESQSRQAGRATLLAEEARLAARLAASEATGEATSQACVHAAADSIILSYDSMTVEASPPQGGDRTPACGTAERSTLLAQEDRPSNHLAGREAETGTDGEAGNRGATPKGILSYDCMTDEAGPPQGGDRPPGCGTAECSPLLAQKDQPSNHLAAREAQTGTDGEAGNRGTTPNVILSYDCMTVEADEADAPQGGGRGARQKVALPGNLAAVEIGAARIQLEFIRRRIELLENLMLAEPADLVTLQGAGEILDEIVEFYVHNLVPLIAAELAPLCSQHHQAVHMARMAECVLILPQLRGRARALWQTPARTGNVEWLNQIFARALRGQLHLGFDGQTEGVR